jgi:hypothetical protein
MSTKKKKWANCIRGKKTRQILGPRHAKTLASRGRWHSVRFVIGCTILSFLQLLRSRCSQPLRSPRISPQKTNRLRIRLLLSMYGPIISLVSLCPDRGSRRWHIIAKSGRFSRAVGPRTDTTGKFKNPATASKAVAEMVVTPLKLEADKIEIVPKW